MSYLLKLKNAINKNIPSFYVRQEVNIPIFTFDLKNEVSSELVFEQALKYQKNASNNFKKDLVKNGYQTPYLDSRTNSEFKILLSSIEHKVLETYRRSYSVKEFWFVFYNVQGSQALHNHSCKIQKYPISAVYYPKLGNDPAPIIFQTKSIENDISEVVIPVRENMLILFHSELNHYVPPQTTSEPRVVFSCNLSEK